MLVKLHDMILNEKIKPKHFFSFGRKELFLAVLLWLMQCIERKQNQKDKRQHD